MVSDILIAVRENDMRALPTFCRAMHSVYHARISNWTNLLMSQNSCMVVSVHVISLHSFNVNFLNNFSTELPGQEKQKQSSRGVPYKEQVYNFIKKETLAQVFFCEFCNISKNTFTYGTPPVAASRKTKLFNPLTLSWKMQFYFSLYDLLLLRICLLL